MRVGDQVKAGDIIADGPSTDLGDLALGQNVLVAFMPWNGYNFEDSILLSERIVKDDVFTSIHIEEFDVMARDTKLGPEEITRDIPNVGEEALKNLDEAGIVYIGAEVKPGDILVGKITPKGESPMTPEEKLLRAIFGEKASDVRDTSLQAAAGRFRHGRRSARVQPPWRRQGRARARHRARGDRASRQGPRRRTRDPRPQLLWPPARLPGRQAGCGRAQGPQDRRQDHARRTSRTFRARSGGTSRSSNEKAMAELEAMRQQYEESKKRLENRFLDKVEKLQRGDELPPGVMKMVKVFVAVKRKIQPGDKMAGRHGNKGVVSKIVPVEDMPFLEDGTHVDIVLNPLGVPSRMNVGQILETHLGWACAGLGQQDRRDAGGLSRDAARPSRCATSINEIYGKNEEIDAPRRRPGDRSSPAT